MKAKRKKAKAGGASSAKARKALFVDAYLANGGNATQAAITAGYSEKTAKQQGSRLLTSVDIREAIAKRTQVVAEKVGLSVERTLQELARLAYADPRKLYKEDGSLKAIHELDDDAAATIASVEVDEIGMEGVVIGHTKKLKQWDKNAALEKAMKYHGLYEKDNEQKPPTVLMPGVKTVTFEPYRARGKERVVR